ncbi:hypothetical protein [Deinococcus marmoris]|uniref:Uncharacterized protein n=1 Tax=Deinococcus marmoris TaxID=249408 RepID=A0A1U7P4T4_9DEIO|nr:hypothetical protein [Deinococcus marmoris]OLV20168.1 hypothetical protein BOO71_0000532 [Deinococcus marmoris]
MSKQILDAGDEVVITRDSWSAQQACVVSMDEYGTYTLAAEGGSAAGLILHMKRTELIRCNGDLQIGDWVRVNGTCEQAVSMDVDTLEDEPGLIVDDYPEKGGPDFKVFLQGENRPYECRAGQLTRVARKDQQ